MLRDVFKRLKCCLDLWLNSMFDCIHICIFLFIEKLFLSNIDSSLTPFDTWLIYQALQLPFIAISIASRSIEISRFLLDTFLTASLIYRAKFLCILFARYILNPLRHSFTVNKSSIAPRYLHFCRDLVLDRSSIYRTAFLYI